LTTTVGGNQDERPPEFDGVAGHEHVAETRAVATKRRTADKTKPSSELPERAFTSTTAWSEWLAKHHAGADGIWMKIAKAGSTARSIGYSEALDGALAWGWIDGQKRGLDDEWWLQKFTPRRARSMWSKTNRQKAEALIEAGAMQPSGLAEVERAKQDGRWDRAYDSAKTAAVPEDLEAALAANRKAKAFFAKLDAANRYAILYRVQTAKKPETRARRIAEFVRMCAEGRKLHER
jgi:uncharacterized protein YdeI (YjbR/CyaY-like superfamily)